MIVMANFLKKKKKRASHLPSQLLLTQIGLKSFFPDATSLNTNTFKDCEIFVNIACLFSKRLVSIELESRTLTREKQFSEEVTDECCKEIANAKIIESLKIERAFYLSPKQVVDIIEGNPNLRLFSFTPRLINSLSEWIGIFIQYSHRLKFGEDFFHFYKYVDYGYSSSYYNRMYDSAPQWASMDLLDEDSSTEVFYMSLELTW